MIDFEGESMSAEERRKPPLAALVMSGEGQKEAVAITDFIFMAKDISNAYLVTTADGDVMINTGFHGQRRAQQNFVRVAPHGPLRDIILIRPMPTIMAACRASSKPGPR